MCNNGRATRLRGSCYRIELVLFCIRCMEHAPEQPGGWLAGWQVQAQPRLGSRQTLRVLEQRHCTVEHFWVYHSQYIFYVSIILFCLPRGTLPSKGGVTAAGLVKAIITGRQSRRTLTINNALKNRGVHTLGLYLGWVVESSNRSCALTLYRCDSVRQVAPGANSNMNSHQRILDVYPLPEDLW
jgi:hypothetical protein